jgi:hypothetical protein
VKLDRTLLFQGLLSLALVAFAALFAISLLTSLRPPPTGEPPEASRDLIVADRAEWKQFYDAVVGSERAPQVAQPADPAPEKPAAGGVAEVPAATAAPEDQAPGASVSPTAVTAMPVVPDPVAREPAAGADAPPAQVAAPPDPPREKGVEAAAAKEPSGDKGPSDTARSVSIPEAASPALATAPVPPPDAVTEKSAESTIERAAESTTLPAAEPVPMPRPRVAAPAAPIPGPARAGQAAPPAERQPERSRPATPARPRVAVPRQRPAPRIDGPQRIDPQQFGPQQSGTMSYAPQQNNTLPPGGPQFGPYFPYGSTPPTAQQLRAQQSRSPQPAYTDPFGWR